ncbi:family 16 glycoside hydrolase [Pseudohyphozyma bogoriensis]|nr:family 16 glycoside hydrolase [Pseudohyphozyma bogoriensis]
MRSASLLILLLASVVPPAVSTLAHERSLDEALASHARGIVRRGSDLIPGGLNDRSARKSGSSRAKRSRRKKNAAKSCEVHETTSRMAVAATSTFDSANFFDNFDFFTDADPTHGTVTYVSQSTAESDGLISTDNGVVTMKVDDTTTLDSGVGRNAVRVTSKETISIGTLLVLDAKKIPYGGEIDIVEQVDDVSQNQMTLHTSDGCTLTTPMDALGTVLVEDCNANIDGNQGCGVQDPSTSSFGSAFETAGGGVYAVYWSEEGIKVWSFTRDNIPADLTSGAPDVTSWGSPTAFWSSASCSMSQFFGPQTIVINTTLCGDWAGATYSTYYSGTCNDAVMDPTNYVDADWQINYVKVFTANA